jgi:hypothetical protein
MADIDISGFSGANNVKEDERFFSKRGIAEPRVILNATVDVTGKLTKRDGKTLFWNLPGAHSLWAGVSCMFCVAQGVLYRNVGGAPVNIGSISGPKHPISYVDAEDKIYMSNRYWQGVFDPALNTLAAWGVPPPPGPTLLVGSGNLPAGLYRVCMTNVSNGELSGSSPITEIELTAEGGIQILNRPSGALTWVTDANEGVFYLAGETSKIIDLPTVEPLPSFLCSPPPGLENLCYAFGRIWGSVGKTVFYTQPFKTGWFRLDSNRYDFEDDVTMIAKVPTGLFIGMNGKTTFLAGTIPEQMMEADAGAGAVPGTLAYCNNMPYLADVLGTDAKVISDVPVWLSEDGYVAGNVNGRVFNITAGRVKMGIPTSGASLYRNLNGMIQFLSSFRQGSGGSGVGSVDADTLFAFRNGHIDIHNAREEPAVARAAFTDSATCTVTRGGVEI